MGSLALLALMSGLLLTAVLGSDGGAAPEEPETPDVADEPETPDIPDEPEEPEIPTEPLDTGATFAATEDGVNIEIGEDETGSLAVIYYDDTEDRSDPAEFLEIYEARFYLVPEGVDWSGAAWETRDIIPGQAEFGPSPGGYELADFEEHFELELLGTVDIRDDPLDTQTPPAERMGAITANAPVAGYLMSANTDGDELVTFLPEDYVITRDGVPELPVFEDTTGTAGTDWLSADADGITVDGAAGDDYLETDNDNVTLIGGAGDDSFVAYGPNVVIDGGQGDDEVRAGDVASVSGGDGIDRITVNSGSVTGGDGNDRLENYGDGTAELYGQEGDDSLSVSGVRSEGYGGDGNDFVGVSNGATGFGGAGDDRLQLDSGTTGIGGNGDDLFTVWNQFRDEEGPAVATGGAGADTYNVLVRNASNGEADDLYLRITDFDTTEDVLQLGPYQSNNDVQSFDIVEADDGSYTDVRVTYAGLGGQPPGIAVIRLEGTTGVSADQIAIVT